MQWPNRTASSEYKLNNLEFLVSKTAAKDMYIRCVCFKIEYTDCVLCVLHFYCGRISCETRESERKREKRKGRGVGG